MRKIGDRIAAALIAIVVSAYASYAMALSAVLIELRIVISLVAALCIVLFAFLAIRSVRRLSAILGEQVDVANNIVRINFWICAVLFFAFMGLGVSGVPMSPKTSMAFATLGMVLIFGCWRVYNALTLSYLDREIDKLEIKND